MLPPMEQVIEKAGRADIGSMKNVPLENRNLKTLGAMNMRPEIASRSEHMAASTQPTGADEGRPPSTCCRRPCSSRTMISKCSISGQSTRRSTRYIGGKASANPLRDDHVSQLCKSVSVSDGSSGSTLHRNRRGSAAVSSPDRFGRGKRRRRD